MNEDSLQRLISQSGNTNSNDTLRDYTEDLLLLIQDMNCFPNDKFDSILSLIQYEQFQRMEGSHYLFLLFEQAWEFISEKQKYILLPILETIYEKYTDKLTWFMITELMGEYFNNEAALLTLMRLELIEDENAKSLVPHGLEHFIKSTEDKKLAYRAYSELVKLKSSPSRQLAAEAALSLKRLLIKPYQYDPANYNPS